MTGEGKEGLGRGRTMRELTVVEDVIECSLGSGPFCFQTVALAFLLGVVIDSSFRVGRPEGQQHWKI